MKKNLFLSILLLTAVSTVIVGMDTNKNQIQKNDAKTELANITDELVIEESNNIAKPTFIGKITNSVVNVYNNVKNSITKDVTRESDEEYKNNIAQLNNIENATHFVNDWKQHTLTKNTDNASFLRKGSKRSHAYTQKTIALIFDMQTNNSYDVSQLEKIDQSMTKTEAYNTALFTVFKNQRGLIKNRIDEKLNNSNLNNNNNGKDDKSDKEQN